MYIKPKVGVIEKGLAVVFSNAAFRKLDSKAGFGFSILVPLWLQACWMGQK